ncbi:hypothetical protein N3K66_007915 [Trichothecium roseum]|uniref:Uncharacterized protein n=1 Tax=Trichothecium roseum TaxID=47278 RepID=A0ACC0US17_9HYPO|nr:hypothetical protein N3K66_007915 [Trichothecium roseum]
MSLVSEQYRSKIISRRKYKEDEVEQDLLRRDEANIKESMQRLDGVLQEAKNNYEAAQSDVKHARDNTGGLSTFGFIALASVANPIIKTVAHATDLVKGIPDLVGKFASPTFGIRTSTDKEYDPKATESASKKSGRKTESPRTRAADNIAFEKAWELSQVVKNVQALLDSEGQESAISDYIDEIKNLRNEIQPRSTWSAIACTILSDCEKVLIKMLKLHRSSHDLNTTNAKLQHIKTWSEELAKAETLATKLVTKANSEPGAVFGMIPPMFDAKTTPLIRPDNTMDCYIYDTSSATWPCRGSCQQLQLLPRGIGEALAPNHQFCFQPLCVSP